MKPSTPPEELETGEPLVRFTLDLPAGLHRQFKMAAVSEGKSMRALAMEWVRAGIAEINGPARKK